MAKENTVVYARQAHHHGLRAAFQIIFSALRVCPFTILLRASGSWLDVGQLIGPL